MILGNSHGRIGKVPVLHPEVQGATESALLTSGMPLLGEGGCAQHPGFLEPMLGYGRKSFHLLDP